MPVLRSNGWLEDARTDAARYETCLDPTRRKRLGQFFSGVPLGRLLASISLDTGASTVIDPMAGHGDLLDTVIECAAHRGQQLARIEAVEIDAATVDVCRHRLDVWRDVVGDGLIVRAANAFDADHAQAFCADGYDLVITNPPYVRYQALANGDEMEETPTANDVRHALRKIVETRIASAEWSVWRALIDEYSGLADLSVPAWILSGALVRPGGTLALVAPATWRSRNYGEIIQYLLERCFELKYLVEDTQPGWFSDALVRTQLVVARRIPPSQARIPLVARGNNPTQVVTVKVFPPASGSTSLVGAAFISDAPEEQFADWIGSLTDTGEDQGRGLSWSVVPVGDISGNAVAQLQGRKWFRKLEPESSVGPLFAPSDSPAVASIIPTAIKMLLAGLPPASVSAPDACGLSISQGLRTGCNGFFYVDFIERVPPDQARVRLSRLFDGAEVTVPDACLLPVVRKQSEVRDGIEAARLTGRALDLSGWILPEDAEVVERTRHLYLREGNPVPSVMSGELAEFVRRAANTVYSVGGQATRIPELSAVRTNVRSWESGRTPRFWYMLPSFSRRHRPDAFIPRINHEVPSVGTNDDPPALIDANFSTIWGASGNWTRTAIRALFSSAWCRACMEAIGTPLAGGALKLEATHLRRLPLPLLATEDIVALDAIGRQSQEETAQSAAADQFVIGKIFGGNVDSVLAANLLQSLRGAADEWRRARQREAP